MSATQGIYTRAKERLAKGETQTPPEPLKQQQVSEAIIDLRKGYDELLAELDKARPNLEAIAKSLPERRKAIQEFAVLTKILKDESQSLDKIEKDTLLMFQTYLKMQGVTPPEG